MNEYVSILKVKKLSNLVICAERKTQISEIRNSQKIGKKNRKKMSEGHVPLSSEIKKICSKMKTSNVKLSFHWRSFCAIEDFFKF